MYGHHTYLRWNVVFFPHYFCGPRVGVGGSVFIPGPYVPEVLWNTLAPSPSSFLFFRYEVRSYRGGIRLDGVLCVVFPHLLCNEIATFRSLGLLLRSSVQRYGRTCYGRVTARMGVILCTPVPYAFVPESDIQTREGPLRRRLYVWYQAYTILYHAHNRREAASLSLI